MTNQLGSVGGPEGQPRPSSRLSPTAATRVVPEGTRISYGDVQQDAVRNRLSNPPAAVAGTADDLPPPSAGEAERLRWAAQQLEALLMHELLKSMRGTVMKAGLFDSQATRMFEEMLDDERAQQMARDGGLGLAELVYEQMSRHLPPDGKQPLRF